MLNEITKSKVSFRRKLKIFFRCLGYKLTFADRRWSKISSKLFLLPGEEGQILRRIFYRKYFKHIGSDVKIGPSVRFVFPEKISLFDDVRINENCYLNGYAEIKIKERVLIGPFTMIHSANHVIPKDRKAIFNSGYEGKMIVLEKDSLISAHCSVLAGVKIGEGSVLGAGAVATGNIPSFGIYGGIPAKLIKNRS